MARILSAVYTRGTVRAVINLQELEKVFGARSDDFGEMLAQKIVSKCFGGDARVGMGYSFIAVERRGESGEMYGFLERCLQDIERELLSDRGRVEHYVLMFASANSLEPFDYSVYCLSTSLSRGVVHRAVGLAAHSLRREGVECVSFGRRVVCYSGGVELPDRIVVETVLGELALERCGDGFADFWGRKGRLLGARFFNFSLRDLFRSKGFFVRGNGVFEKTPVLELEDVVVRRGFSFMSRVSEEGVVRFFVSPKFSVESPPLYEYSGNLTGVRVKSEELDVAGVLRGFEDGKFLVDVDGYVFRIGVGELWRVYSFDDLEQMGVLEEVLSATRLGPQRVLELMRGYVSLIDFIEVAGSSIVFETEPLPV